MPEVIREVAWSGTDTDYAVLVLRDVWDGPRDDGPPARSDRRAPLDEMELASWGVNLDVASGVGWAYLPRTEQFEAPRVRAEVWDAAPAADDGDWDLVVELPFESETGRLRQESLIPTDDETATVLDLGRSGAWRLRAHRRPATDVAAERWLLQLWPAAVGSPRWLRRPGEAAAPADVRLADSWQESGWFEVLPRALRNLVWPLLDQPMTKPELAAIAASTDEPDLLEQPLWDRVPQPWPSGDDEYDAAERRHAAERNEQTEQTRRRTGVAAARLGMPVPETWGDAFDFLVAAGVFVPADGELDRFAVAEHPRLASSVVPELFDLDQATHRLAARRHGSAAGEIALVASWCENRQVATTLRALAELTARGEPELDAALRIAEAQGALTVERRPGDALVLGLLGVADPVTAVDEPVSTDDFVAAVRAAVPDEMRAEREERLRRLREIARTAGRSGTVVTLSTVVIGRVPDPEPAYDAGGPPSAGVVTYEGSVLRPEPEGTWRRTHELRRHVSVSRTARGALALDGPLLLLTDDGGQEQLDPSYEKFLVSADGRTILLSGRRGRGRSMRGRLTLLSLDDRSHTDVFLPGSEVPFLVGFGAGVVWAAQHRPSFRREGSLPLQHYRWRPGQGPEPLPHAVMDVDPLTGATLERIASTGEHVLRRLDGSERVLRVGGPVRLVPGAAQAYVPLRDALLLHDVEGAEPRRLPFRTEHASLTWEDPTHCIVLGRDEELLRLDIVSGAVERYVFPEEVGYRPSLIAPVLTS